MAHLWPVRAKAPRCRVLRARLGVLEDVFGSAGGRRMKSALGDDGARARFVVRKRTMRMLVVKEA